MRKLVLLLLTLIAVVGVAYLLLGSGNSNSPTGAVEAFIDTILDKQFYKIPQLTCASQETAFAQRFDFGTLLTNAVAGKGIDAQRLLDAMTFEITNLDIAEISRTENQAIVHLSGQLRVSVDSKEFKNIMRQTLGSQATSATADELLDQACNPVLEQINNLSQGIDTNVRVTRQNGQWLICDN